MAKKKSAPKTLRALRNVPATMLDPADTFGPAVPRGDTFVSPGGAAEKALVSAGYAEEA